VAFLKALVAFLSLALMIAFVSGSALLRAFMRARTFLQALSCFFKAILLTGMVTVLSLSLIKVILFLRGTFDSLGREARAGAGAGASPAFDKTALIAAISFLRILAALAALPNLLKPPGWD